jgi:RNA polymerase sigma-70 factor (ECF subfamily)
MSDSQKKDSELVADLKNGRREALNELDRRHRARLIGALKRMVGNQQDAEDIYQESLLKAATRIDAFWSDGNFYNWLCTIALNQCRDDLRRRKRRSVPAGMGAPQTPTRNDPLAQLEQKELHGKIADAIAKLPPRQQQIVRLRLFDSLRYAQIAERIGGDSQTIKSLFCKARQSLKLQLESYLAAFFVLYPRRVCRAEMASVANGATTTLISFTTAIVVHLTAMGMFWYGGGTTGAYLGNDSAQQVVFVNAASRSTHETARPTLQQRRVAQELRRLDSLTSSQTGRQNRLVLSPAPEKTAAPDIFPLVGPTGNKAESGVFALADAAEMELYHFVALNSDGRTIPSYQMFEPLASTDQGFISANGSTRFTPVFVRNRPSLFEWIAIGVRGYESRPSTTNPRRLDRVTNYLRIHTHPGIEPRASLTVERGAVNFPIRPLEGYARKYLWQSVTQLPPREHTPLSDTEALYDSPMVFWIDAAGWNDGALVLLTPAMTTLWYNAQNLAAVSGAAGKMRNSLIESERRNLRDYLLRPDGLLVAVATRGAKAQQLEREVRALVPGRKLENIYLPPLRRPKQSSFSGVIDFLNATDAVKGVWMGGRPAVVFVELIDDRVLPDVVELLVSLHCESGLMQPQSRPDWMQLTLRGLFE